MNGKAKSDYNQNKAKGKKDRKRVSPVQYVSRDGKNKDEIRNRYSMMNFLIGEYVTGKKAKRNRAILREYFLDGYTYEEVAEHFDMSAIQIGRIVHRYGDPILLLMSK